MIRTLCRHCKLVKATKRDGLCDECRKSHGSWSEFQKLKGNRHQRGYGSAWVKLRKIIIERDKGLCQECLRVGIYTQGTDVDHIIPKAKGGTDDIDNLQLLCRQCHINKTAKEKVNDGRQNK